MGEPDYIINKILSTVKSIIDEANSMESFNYHTFVYCWVFFIIFGRKQTIVKPVLRGHLQQGKKKVVF